MKHITFFIIVLLISSKLQAQDDKTITLNASASGKTEELAIQAALRSAVEQAFGTFISSNTQLVNDALLKDEISSVSNGNIQKFDVVSKVVLPDSTHAVTVSATVSVTKMSSFVESKGFTSDFKGNLFAFNINAQILNEQNEIKAMEAICKVLDDIARKSFDFKVTVKDPVAASTDNSKWEIPYYVSVFLNNNIINYQEYLFNSLKGLSLKESDVKSYIDLKKEVYPVSFASQPLTGICYLRTRQAAEILIKQLYSFNEAITSSEINNGLTSVPIRNKTKELSGLYDGGFRFFLLKYPSIQPASVFYMPVSYDIYTNGLSRMRNDDSDGVSFEIELSGGSSLSGIYTMKGMNIDNPDIGGNFSGSDYTPYLNSTPILGLIFQAKHKDEFLYMSAASNGKGWDVFDIYRPIDKVPPLMSAGMINMDKYSKDRYTQIHLNNSQYSFTNGLSYAIQSNRPGSTFEYHRCGLTISFIGINPNTEAVRFYFKDPMNLEEIKKITGYKVGIK